MRIVITGAGGNANRQLIPHLIAEGHEVIALDVAALDYDCACHRVSIFDDLALQRHMRGADCVVHAAGTADHSLPRSPAVPDAYHEWWRMSGASTHHLFRSVLYAEVPKVIFFGTQEYYRKGPGFVDEDFPASRPAEHYYDLSKVISEDIAHFYAARHGIDVVMLRPGNFTGCPEPGPAFLGNRLRREDMAQAVRLAIDYEPEGGYEAFNVLAGNPFSADELEDMRERPMALIERHWPGAAEMMIARGDEWQGGDRMQTCRRIVEQLGYRPRFTFETYLERIGYR